MSAFVRRFLFDPGLEVLTNIEAVNILDLEPPEPIKGVGSGMVMVVGEFENGPFNTPTQVFSSGDMKATFGEFGYTYFGVVAQNPCARARNADNAVVAEYWNGNGATQLNGKAYAQLVVVRVDTGVGSVQFTREASLLGAAKVAWSLVSGQHLDVDFGAGASVATFTGVAAVVTGASAAFASITAGATVTLGYDDAADFQVTFLTGDTTIAAVLARINQYAGFAFASNASGQLRLTGRRAGTSGQVRVVSGSTGTVTNLGLTVANTAGTGNVGDIAAVSPTEANTIIAAAVTGARFEVLSDGTPRLVNTTTPVTGTIKLSTATTATDFGFPINSEFSAAAGTAGLIPAGTRVSNNSTKHYVTMADLVITSGNAGPYSVRVRPATDDGTGVAATAATVTTVEFPIDLGAFAVTNAVGLTVALTEVQIDAAYEDAFDSALNLNTIAKKVNVSFSARQSNAVRRKGRQNALDASAGGMQGRIFVTRPPLGTTRAVALGSAEPGVPPYRNQRLVYCYPGLQTKVSRIAVRGTAGGAGFTATGIIDVGADGFLCSVMSQLPPEENPAQETGFMGGALAIESSPNAAGFDINSYIAFKAAGICAPIVDDGQAGFQSGVTSVDPSIYSSLAPIARRRMADFIQDSLANSGKKHVKKLSRVARRIAVRNETRQFLRALIGANPNQQRIAGFTVDDKSGNTGATIAAGVYRLITSVRTISSIDALVFETTIGNTVIVQELAPGEIQ